MKKPKKIYFFPKTKLGKISFWIVLLIFISIFLSYWSSMIFNLSIRFPGFISVGLICIFGITSIISIIKNKDYAISLFISSLIGIFWILFALGELFYPH